MRSSLVVVAGLLAVAGCGEAGSGSSSDVSQLHAVGDVTVVAVHDDFSFYGPCGNSSVDVFGTTYYQLYPEEFEALDESRYPHVEGEEAAPSGFARVAPPGPGDDIGRLIVYSDGMARYESDSGTVEWFTTDEHTYNWDC